MSTGERNRWLQLRAGALTLVACAWVALPAQAILMHTYDLDSLVYLSTDVVEAEIVRSYEADHRHLMDVKVTRVHKGRFRKTETIVVWGAEGYRKPKKGAHNPANLDIGDSLVLFLTPQEGPGMVGGPTNLPLYVPVASGIKLVQGENVFGFCQWSNPGPYVANVQEDVSKSPVLSLEHFREQLRDSLRNTQQWARLLEAEKVGAPALLALLASRPKTTFKDVDHIGELVCVRLAHLHDPEVLGQALPLVAPDNRVRILGSGFGTPAGRAYLLGKVNDSEEPVQTRIMYARALAAAGPYYGWTSSEIGAHFVRYGGQATPGNSGYITRIARAAQHNVCHTGLCVALLECINAFCRTIGPSPCTELNTDLRGALSILKVSSNPELADEVTRALKNTTANVEKLTRE
jgi:hypothetical protein